MNSMTHILCKNFSRLYLLTFYNQLNRFSYISFKKSTDNEQSTIVTQLRRNVHEQKFKTVNLSYTTYDVPADAENIASPLLIAHGLMGSKSNWNSICKAMQKKLNPARKLIAVDLRNHGDSPHSAEHTYHHLVADINLLLFSLGIEKACLMGHSMGGRAVMSTALTYPDIVDRLIVVDISPKNNERSMEALPYFFKVMKMVEIDKGLSISDARKQAHKKLASYIEDESLRSFLITNLIQKEDGSYVWRLNVDSLEKNYQNISKFPDFEGAVFQKPTLFIAGGASDFFPAEHSEAVKPLFPNAQIEFIAGAGHWLHAEKPELFVEIVTQFLNKP